MLLRTLRRRSDSSGWSRCLSFCARKWRHCGPIASETLPINIRRKPIRPLLLIRATDKRIQRLAGDAAVDHISDLRHGRRKICCRFGYY